MAFPRNLTIKTQEAIEQSQSVAERFGQQKINPLHLFFSILNQPDTIVESLFQKLNINIAEILNQTVKVSLEKDKVVLT